MTPQSTVRAILIAVGVAMFLWAITSIVAYFLEFLLFRSTFSGHLLAPMIYPVLLAIVGFHLAVYAHIPARWFCSEPLPESY